MRTYAIPTIIMYSGCCKKMQQPREVEMDKEIKFGGHWIICSDEKINIICSNCGNNIDFKEGEPPRFCPKCNAVMVGDANETNR